MKRMMKFGGGILFIPAAVLAGYALTKVIVYALPDGDNNAALYGVAQLVITLLLLVVPYIILKAGFFAAHAKNKREHEIELSDLPRPEKKAYRKGDRRRWSERQSEARIS
jgi:hypothetical protein